ncbi:unnamed protein product [Amoebophrya sp. A120]|nr:unnamed protein product [Amoebophrya sp. A120]|eukprot:GSA120T00008367001.1
MQPVSRLIALIAYVLEEFPVTLILLCSIGPYFRSLFYSEWYIDELFAIVRNEDAKNESSWVSVFSHDFWGNPLWAKGAWTHKSYRPLTVLSYCLEFWNIGDIKPQPLRAFSMWLHALNSVLLYFVALKFHAVKVKRFCSFSDGTRKSFVRAAGGGGGIVEDVPASDRQGISAPGSPSSATTGGENDLDFASSPVVLGGKKNGANSSTSSGGSAIFSGKNSLKTYLAKFFLYHTDEVEDVVFASTTTTIDGRTSSTSSSSAASPGNKSPGAPLLAVVPNAWAITLACCLFAAHPVHVENVVYLVGRADMMATAIWILVFYVYLDSNSVSLFPLHALLCLTAGLCKESGFMVIPFLVTVEVTRPNRNILTGMLFLVMFLLIFGFRSYLTGGTSAGFSFVDTPIQYSGSLLTRTLSYMYQHAFYCKLLLFPWDLSWDYSYDAIPLLKTHFDDYRCLLIATVYLGLVALVSRFANGRRRQSRSSGKHPFVGRGEDFVQTSPQSHQGLVGVFWVLVPFLPASNLFFVVGVTVGERLLYCSTCGIAFFVPAIINQLCSGSIQFSSRTKSGLGFFPALSPTTRAPSEADSMSDSSSASKGRVSSSASASKAPAARKRSRGASPANNARKSKNQNNLSEDNLKQMQKTSGTTTPSSTTNKLSGGLAQESSANTNLSCCRILVFLFSFLWLAAFVVNCTIRVGHWRNREVLFGVDTASWPRSLKSHHQLGTVYHRENRWEEALHHYNMSLVLHDDNALTDYCIAQVYIETSRFELALPRFEKIMKGHGIGFAGYNTFALFVDYGFTLTILKRYEEAVNAIEHGLKINADLPHGWNALGVAYGNLNMLQEAQDALANGLKWEPEQAFLWSNMAAVWMLAGAWEQAQMGLAKALEKEPDNPVFLFNLQILQFALNGQPEVIEQHKPRLELFYNRMN